MSIQNIAYNRKSLLLYDLETLCPNERCFAMNFDVLLTKNHIRLCVKFVCKVSFTYFMLFCEIYSI